MKVSIKSENEDTFVVGGYGIIWDSTDLHGEHFSRDTDFELDWIPNKKVLYDHGQNEYAKGVIGLARNDRIVADDVGLFIEAEISKSHKYSQAIRKLVEAGVIGYSTGTVPQLMERSGNKIVKWPLVEISLTSTPAEHKTLGVKEIEEFAKIYEELNSFVNDAGVESSPASKTGETNTAQKQDDSATQNKIDSVNITESEEKQMSDVNVNTGAGRPESLEEAQKMINESLSNVTAKFEKAVGDLSGKQHEELDAINTKIESIISFLENSGTKAGYVTQDGGNADKSIKSFADFLVSVKRNDATRLKNLYHSTKDLGEDSGASGGYLVPAEYEETLLQMASMNNPVTQRVRRIPVMRASGSWPALDQYITPTAGSGATAFAGGVTSAVTPAGSALTETEPSFNLIEWRLNKVGGFTEVDNELIEDSPFAIEALLTGLFSVAISAKNERNILRGSGVGEPLGILNAAAAIGVSPSTDNTFSWVDVAAMYSRFLSAGGTPVWLVHPGVWPDIMTMEIGSNGAAAWTANMQGPAGNNINGYSILTSEHLPQDDNAGDVLLADLSAYLLFEKRGIMIAFSEHAAFVNEKGTWRFSQRTDGKPWLKSAVTLADPQGSYTVSPFVYHND